MNSLGNLIGEICKAVIPIPEEYYLGNNRSSVAVCTLSSIDLLKKLANSEILNHICLVGRLLSENKGIDSIIKYVNQNKTVQTIVICGKEVSGHKAGYSLFQLHKNGVDKNGRIIDSISPDPVLTVSQNKIEYFRKNILLVDMINETNFEKIYQKII